MGGKDKGKNVSIKKYLDKIKAYLSDMINNHKVQRKMENSFKRYNTK